VSREPIPLEEALIREAVSRIRKWLREKGREGKTFSPPRLALRFCGGCNPIIERGVVGQKIRENLASEVKWVSGDDEKDFLLIINGCRTACADTNEIRGGHPVVIVSGDFVFA
jgi:hypothetical protein